MTETQSSLLGGDNAEMHEIPGTNGTAGATPSRNPIFTPNPLATPYRQPGLNGSSGAVTKVGATPLRTPRDSLALNQDGMGVVGSTPREIKLQERSAKSSLRAQLASLPKPKETDWELELPEEQQEILNQDHVSEEDAVARDARNALIRKAAEEAEFKRKTQVIQRNLPKLPPTTNELLSKAVPNMDKSIKQAIVSEMALLISNDRQPNLNFRTLDDEAIRKARAAIHEEMPKDVPEVEADIEQTSDPAIFPLVNDAIEKLAELGMESEKKLTLHHGGYQKRAKVLRQKIIEAAQALESSRVQSHVSRTAQITEESAISSRLDQLREEVLVINKREREAQEYYRLQRDELDSLLPVSNGVH